MLSTIVDLPIAIPTLVTGVMLLALYGPNSPIGRFFDDLGIQIIFRRSRSCSPCAPSRCRSSSGPSSRS